MEAAWVAIGIAIIAALGSIAAAVISGRFASKAKVAELQAARIQELEKRPAESKAKMYSPMIDTLGKVMDSAGTGRTPNERDLLSKTMEFAKWVQIYGSDDAVRAVHRFMQAAYSGPPPDVMMRFFYELLLEIRKDLGDPETEVTLADLLGIRIKDLYARPDWRDMYLSSRRDFFRRVGWAPPWGEEDE